MSVLAPRRVPHLESGVSRGRKRRFSVLSVLHASIRGAAAAAPFTLVRILVQTPLGTGLEPRRPGAPVGAGAAGGLSGTETGSAVPPGWSPEMDTLIRGIHAAAGCEHRWQHVVSHLRRMFRGRAAMLARHDFATGRGEWLFESPVNPSEHEAYATEYSVRNPWFISSLEYRPGRVMTGDDLIDAEVLHRSDFYRHHLKRLGLYHKLCGVVLRREDVVWCMDLFRGRTQPAFGAQERALFGSILKHLTISFENHRQLASEQTENHALRSLVDRLAPTMFVVDGNGRLLLANASSAEFLENFKGIEIRGGRVAAVSPAENRALFEAIAEATAGGSGDDSATKTFTVFFHAEPWPVVMSIISASVGRLDAFGERHRVAVLVVKDPRPARGDFHCRAFTSLFNLTHSQGRLAGLILAGYNLSRASRMLRVSENTARSHLKQIYLKTDTHSQVELVHLHARICTEHL